MASNFIRAAGALAVAISLAAPALAQSPAPPSTPTFPAPAGPYAVGTARFVWTDPGRPDPTAEQPDARRQLIVQLWYPAAPGSAANPAPYVMEPGIEATIVRFVEGPVASVQAPAKVDTPAAGRFPLILFSHGRGTPRALYTTYVARLASAGYVVAAIDHPGLGATAMGARVVGPYNPWVTAPQGLRDRSEDEREAYWEAGRVQLSADQRFVIDKVAELSRTARSLLAGHVDMDQVAMAGHSSGFLSATCLDRRVRACINLAGVAAMAERRGGLDRPLLTIHDASGSPTQTSITATMRAPAYDLYLRGSNHNSVTDLELFGPAEGRPAALKRLTVMGDYSIAFLDHVLLGKPASLLTPTKATDPDAILTWYGPVQSARP